MMNKKTTALLFISICQLSLAAAIAENRTKGNSTWVYDSLYNDQGVKIGYQPGLFANDISNYNLLATPQHRITQVFSYGGDLEMYCKGAGESDLNDICTDKNMLVFYSQGETSTTAYTNALKNTAEKVDIIPIIDGRLDVDGAEDYLSPFNTMDEATAKVYADKVAKLYCADDRVFGIQFDIEPFDINQPGQAYFYQQIAKNLAGKNNPRPDGSDPLSCVNPTHPQGRFFSVFTFANNVNQKLAGILNRYQNGYVIDSLYDLGQKPGGNINAPQEYKQYVDTEIKLMLENATKYNVKFQLAVAAAASAHEFESKAGASTGYQQLAYVKAAFESIQLNHVKEDKNYLGMAIWSYNDKMIWHHDAYAPAKPDDKTLAYLAENL